MTALQTQVAPVKQPPFEFCTHCGAGELEGGFTDEVLTLGGQRVVWDQVKVRGAYDMVRRCYDRIACWARYEGTTREQFLTELEPENRL